MGAAMVTTPAGGASGDLIQVVVYKWQRCLLLSAGNVVKIVGYVRAPRRLVRDLIDYH